MVFRHPEELGALQNNPTDSRESIWKFSSTLQPAHVGFCSFVACQIIKVEKEKGNTLRGKISWKVAALSKIDALLKQAL